MVKLRLEATVNERPARPENAMRDSARADERLLTALEKNRAQHRAMVGKLSPMGELQNEWVEEQEEMNELVAQLRAELPPCPSSARIKTRSVEIERALNGHGESLSKLDWCGLSTMGMSLAQDKLRVGAVWCFMELVEEDSGKTATDCFLYSPERNLSIRVPRVYDVNPNLGKCK